MLTMYQAGNVVKDITALSKVQEEVVIHRTFDKDYTFSLCDRVLSIWFDDELQGQIIWEEDFPFSTAGWLRENSK